MSTVVARPSRISSATHAPTAGAALNPVPGKPPAGGEPPRGPPPARRHRLDPGPREAAGEVEAIRAGGLDDRPLVGRDPVLTAMRGAEGPSRHPRHPGADPCPHRLLDLP